MPLDNTNDLIEDLNNLGDNNEIKTLWEDITGNTTGTITVYQRQSPYETEIIPISLDKWMLGENALVVPIEDSRPTDKGAVKDANGKVVLADINANGNYVLHIGYDEFDDPIPPATPLVGNYALIWQIKGEARDTFIIPSTKEVEDFDSDPAFVRDTDNNQIVAVHYGDDLNMKSGRFKDTNSTVNLGVSQVGDTESNDLISDKDTIYGIFNDLQYSQSTRGNSGFISWSGTGDYYSCAGTTFTLLRGGTGMIKGKKVVFAGNQDIELVNNKTALIYIDEDGIIGKNIVSPFPDSVFFDYIPLFESFYNGTCENVMDETHPYTENTRLSRFLHNNVGTVIRGAGAIITRVATGTGASPDDRRIKLVGSDYLDDHGLTTELAEINPIIWTTVYTNIAGNWTVYSKTSENPMYYNNAGTPTAIPNGKFVNFRLFAGKKDPNTGLPVYFRIMGTEVHDNILQANNEISNNTTPVPTNELVNIELAQLGLSTVEKNVAGGYIYQLIISKSTFNSKLVGGGLTTEHDLLSNIKLANTLITYGHIDDQAQSIYGIKTFNNFSITPSSAPTTDYQVTNKKYVDDAISTNNPFDQDLNTDDDVIFNGLSIDGLTSLGSDLSVRFNSPSNYNEIKDQEFDSEDAVTSVATMWQSFTAGITGYLSSVSVYHSDGLATTTGITIRVFEGEGIGGNMIAEETGISCNKDVFTNVPLSDLPIVNSGSQYTIQVLETGDDFYWGIDTNGGYTGGRFSGGANQDARFRNYISQGFNVVVDKTNNRVGIGTLTPTEVLEIIGNIKCKEFQAINQPYFLAYNSSTINNISGDGTVYTIIYDTEVEDAGGNYNNSTGIFTAPKDGLYLFTASVRLYGIINTHERFYIILVTTNNDFFGDEINPYNSQQLQGTDALTISISKYVRLSKNDTAKINISIAGGTKVVDVFGSASTIYTHFSGGLIC